MQDFEVTREVRDQMDQALISGLDYKEFADQVPGLPFKKWKNRIFRLRREGRLPRPQKQPSIYISDNACKATAPVVLALPTSLSEVTRVSLKEDRLNKEVLALRGENRELKSEINNRLDTMAALESVSKSLPALFTQMPAFCLSREGEGEVTYIQLLHDLHLGQKFDRGASGGLGHYNLEQAQARIQNLARQLIHKLTPDYGRGRITKLILNFGGDIVDGRTIHPGHLLSSHTWDEQLFLGSEIVTRYLISPLSLKFPKLSIFCMLQVGNHGRGGDKGELDKVLDSQDHNFYRILQIRCQPLSNVTFNHNPTWYSYYKVYGHNVFAEHGDNNKSTGDSPYASIIKRKDKMQRLINSPIDLYLMGHIHTPTVLTHGYGYCVVNGSLAGTNDFAANIGQGGLPLQKLLAVTPDNPMAACYDLRLARREDFLTVQPTLV